MEYRARYYVKQSGDDFVIIDRAGDIPGRPVYRTSDFLRAILDAATLNRGWYILCQRVKEL